MPVELLYLPGLEPAVRAEISARLPAAGPLHPVPGRDDSLAGTYLGRWQDLLALRTIVAPFLVLHFPVPRPRSLTSGEYFPEILAAAHLVQQINAERPATFRFDAAGHESAGYQRLAAQLQQETGLRPVDTDAQLLLRFRRSPGARPGWDVLIRLSSRPLSARPWRVANLPGAANATVAAAMALLAGPRPADRVANLMCGSGTLLIERLALGPAAAAVAVDRDLAALAACARNLRAAGLDRRVTVVPGDIADHEWTRHGPFDLLLADPPWGTLMGTHEASEQLHAMLLNRAHAAAAPGARLAVLTHEVKIMERCLRQAAGQWAQQDVLRVFHKGHHPRVYLLTRQ